MRMFAFVVVHNHTWQLIVCNSKVANIITYTKIEITCSWGKLWKWSWLMIIEYAVPSLALNYPCKEYQIIYESVHSHLWTSMRNKYPCKSENVWHVHIQVMLKVISFSILTMHEFVETKWIDHFSRYKWTPNSRSCLPPGGLPSWSPYS